MISLVKYSFLMLLMTSPLRAEDKPASIVVNFVGIKKPLSCTHDKEEMYICENNGNDIILKHGQYGFSALGRDEKKSPKSYDILKVEANNKLIFQDTTGNFKKNNKVKKLLTEEYSESVGIINNFFPKDRPVGSPQFEEIVKGYIEQKDQAEKKFDSIYQDNKFNITLNNGKNITCSRETTRQLTKKEESHYSGTAYGSQCGIFKCDPVTINGKTYNSTMVYSSIPYATTAASFHLIQNNDLGPKLLINKISSSKSKLLLEDYTSYNKEMGNAFDEEKIASLPASLKKDRQKIATFKNLDVTMPIDHNNLICDKASPTLKQLNSTKEKIFEKLAYTDLAEFIQILADGSLKSDFVDINLAVKQGCHYEGVFLNAEAAKQLKNLKKNIHPDKTVQQTISLEKASELFKKARAMKDIAWEYTADGCYARAHLMARRFEAEGIRVDKVWLKGDLYVPETDTAWNFHVAPIVYVKDGDKIQKMVIDPALFNQPVTVEEWDKKITKKTIRGSTITAFPFPENAIIVERAALAFSSSDPYVPADHYNMPEKEKMEKALNTMILYKQAEESLREVEKK